jgi:hypothetical protein
MQMKQINGKFFKLPLVIIFLIMFIELINFSDCVVHIELKKSSAKYKSDYLKSLKFLQRNIITPISSFLEEREISLHQQV